VAPAQLADVVDRLPDGLDAEVTHRTDELGMIAVQGPTSQQTLQPLVDRDLGELSYFGFWPEQTRVAGVPTNVLRTGFSGERGYELVVSADQALPVWQALVESGGVPFGLTAIDDAGNPGRIATVVRKE